MTSKRLPLFRWLRANGERELRRALTAAWLDGSHRDFYMSAAMALEAIQRAALAEINPLLITDGRFESSWKVADADDAEPWPIVMMHVRTTAAAMLPGQVKRRIPALGRLETGIGTLIIHRNTIAHVGDCDHSHVDAHVTALISAIEVIYDGCAWDKSAAYGEFVDQTRAWQRSASDAALVRLQSKVAAASALVNELYGDSDVDLDSLAELLHAPAWQDTDQYQDTRALPYPCPGCGVDGIVSGWQEYTDVIDYDRDGQAEHGGFEGSLSVYGFRCMVCRLSIEGDELLHAGIPESIAFELSPRDLESLYNEMRAEADIDIYRGR